MANFANAHPRDLVSLPYSSLRNISSPEDLENGRRVVVGHVAATSILSLDTNENVRDYLLDAEGRQRAVPTQVHRAIQETLKDRPQDFSVLNGGVVIVARDVEVDEKNKVIKLTRPSIINGSQTQGVIRDFVKEYGELSLLNCHIKFEIIVTDDDGLIAEISIARNFQNDVMAISIAGRLGQLDELEKSVQKCFPDSKLRKTETQWSNDLDDSSYVPTEKLLQVIVALIPSKLWPRPEDKDNPNKVYTYSRKAQCLKEFQEVYKQAKDVGHQNHAKALELYNFYLDIAPQALSLYKKWKAHQGFKGSRLRSIDRNNKEIVEVPDGIIFPILASLSAFIVKSDSGWVLSPPPQFKDEELIKAAKSAYTEIANSNPQSMGKNKACYSALYQITSIYKMFY